MRRARRQPRPAPRGAGLIDLGASILIEPPVLVASYLTGGFLFGLGMVLAGAVALRKCQQWRVERSA